MSVYIRAYFRTRMLARIHACMYWSALEELLSPLLGCTGPRTSLGPEDRTCDKHRMLGGKQSFIPAMRAIHKTYRLGWFSVYGFGRPSYKQAISYSCVLTILHVAQMFWIIPTSQIPKPSFRMWASGLPTRRQQKSCSRDLLPHSCTLRTLDQNERPSFQFNAPFSFS